MKTLKNIEVAGGLFQGNTTDEATIGDTIILHLDTEANGAFPATVTGQITNLIPLHCGNLISYTVEYNELDLLGSASYLRPGDVIDYTVVSQLSEIEDVLAIETAVRIAGDLLKVDKTTTVNGQPLSGNVTITNIDGNAATAGFAATAGIAQESGPDAQNFFSNGGGWGIPIFDASGLTNLPSGGGGGGGDLTSGPVTSSAGVSAIADGALTAAKISGLPTVVGLVNAATDAATPNTIVKRSETGSASFATITANAGNTASVSGEFLSTEGTAIKGVSTGTGRHAHFGASNHTLSIPNELTAPLKWEQYNNVVVNGETDIQFNTGTFKPPILNANLVWTLPSASGTIALTSSSITGNAATVTTNANLTGVVTSVGNATSIADAALSIAKTSGLQTALNDKASLSLANTFNNVANFEDILNVNNNLVVNAPINFNDATFTYGTGVAAAHRTALGLGTLATQSGTFSGTSSGVNTGDQTNIPGNAATVTTNANLTGVVTSVGNATSIADAALSIAKVNTLQTTLDAKRNNSLYTALGTGILKNTTGTGTPTIAVAADFPTLNQSTTGNAATVTTNANLTGVVTSVGNATSIADGALSIAKTNSLQSTLDGKHAIATTAALATGILKNTTTTGAPSIAVAADFPTLNQSTTGNAATATALQTARTINGVSFSGTANIGQDLQTTASPTFATTRSNGAFDDMTTASGLYTGMLAGTPRLLFANGTAAQNWQIDNNGGVFRWYLPGVEHMTLTSTALGVKGLNASGQVEFSGQAATTANSAMTRGLTDARHPQTSTYAALGTGILKNTTGTGAPSIAVAADFPTLNQNTTGSAATLTTPRNIAGVSFNGSADISLTAANVGAVATTGNETIAGTKTFSGSLVTSTGLTSPSITSTGALGIMSAATTNINLTPGTTGFVDIVKTASTGIRESIMRAKVSDATNDAFHIFNGTSSDTNFQPAFSGSRFGTSGTALQFIANTSAANDTGTSAMIAFEARRTDSLTDPNNGNFASITTRPLLTVSTFGSSFQAFTVSAAGVVSAPTSIASTSTTTGSITTPGGVGVGGNLNVGGTAAVTGLATFTANISLPTSTTPASATAAGVAGTVVRDADFIYVCVSTNVWKRTPLSTW